MMLPADMALLWDKGFRKCAAARRALPPFRPPLAGGRAGEAAPCAVVVGRGRKASGALFGPSILLLLLAWRPALLPLELSPIKTPPRSLPKNLLKTLFNTPLPPPPTPPRHVELYAKDEGRFFADFAAAFSKLLELGVPFPAKA